jgi:glucose-1-phosphate cytidylyltransferase
MNAFPASIGAPRWLAEGRLMAYRHTDFWQRMDTLRNKGLPESLWQKSDAPWNIWKD